MYNQIFKNEYVNTIKLLLGMRITNKEWKKFKINDLMHRPALSINQLKTWSLGNAPPRLQSAQYVFSYLGLILKDDEKKRAVVKNFRIIKAA